MHIQHKLLLLGSVVLKAVWCFNGLDDNYRSCQQHTTNSELNLKRFHPHFFYQDTSNKMFVLFDFIKDKEVVKATPLHKLGGLKLNPKKKKKR